jgi:hypothetical protein
MQPLILAIDPFGVGLGRGSSRTLRARGMIAPTRHGVLEA